MSLFSSWICKKSSLMKPFVPTALIKYSSPYSKLMLSERSKKNWEDVSKRCSNRRVENKGKMGKCVLFLYLDCNVSFKLREQRIWNSLTGNLEVITEKRWATKYMRRKKDWYSKCTPSLDRLVFVRTSRGC